MPPPARKPDPQTDYQDPIDRLYRRRPSKKRDRGDADAPAEKTPNSTATVAFYFGMVGLVPFVGLVFAPLSILLGFIGLAQTRHPNVSGKGRAKSGLWFGLIGMVFNCIILLGCCLWFGPLGRRW